MTEKQNKIILDKEIIDFSEAMKSNANKAYDQYGLILLYSLPDNLRIEYEKLLGFEPATSIDNYNLGVKAISENDLKEAVRRFKNAIKIDEKHMGSYYNLALIHEEFNDKAKAREYYKGYISLYEDIFSKKDTELLQQKSFEEEFYKEAKNRLKAL
ncbi:MAG: hypothetical protein HY934_04075 [Candidatus Firestonebacteria bacterium]|nr:hypothetical protein [Candidatus Firestonebacteria bacterium]